MACKKNTNEIFTVVFATKLEIKRYHFKQTKFFCIEMLLFTSKNFSQNDALWLGELKVKLSFIVLIRNFCMLWFLLLSILCCHRNHDATFWLTNLKDTLMLHACERFELHTFSSFREITTNSLLPRIIDQQLRHFRHQWGVRKVGKRQFPTSVRSPCRNFRP